MGAMEIVSHWVRVVKILFTLHFRNQFGKKIQNISEVIEERKLKLLGHEIKSKNDDPMRQVTYLNDTVKIKKPIFRRVGRPRQDWTYTALEKAWTLIDGGQAYDNENEEMNMKIKEAADSRQAPFHKARPRI